MPRARVLFAALVAAACLGSALTLGVVFAAGGFDRDTVAPAGVAPTSDTTSPTPEDASWASRVYAERVGGVVTVLVDTGKGGVQASGAGFVVDAVKGLIVTNSHVVTNSSDDGVTPQTVQADGAVYIQRADKAREPASVVGYDLFDDIAVLKYDPRGLHLSAVPLGNSASVRVGQPVAAIGAPFGQVESLSVGVVSQIHTQIIAPARVCFRTPDAIQTDAAVNPGNSGGPLFDANGKVIGVTSQIDTGSSGGSGSGVAFAVPVDAVTHTLAQLSTTGDISYPFLGVAAVTLTPDIVSALRLKPTYGAQVTFVKPGSGAARAGISPGSHPVALNGRQVHKDGDVIVSFDGRPVRTLTDLQHDVAAHEVGDTVKVGWWHGRTLEHASIVLDERKATDPDVCRASAVP
jgi:S1-C subfamily serine protease